MTLENVFVGKKVVQQIYLNNAIIYQSKGWETLPCAPTEVWTKTCGNNSTIYNSAVDMDNNIYIATFNAVYKVNSDGILIWKKDFSGETRIGVDKDNNIFVALRTPRVSGIYYDINIYKLDSDGNILATNNKVNDGLVIDTLFGFTVDNSSVYVSMYYSTNNNNNYIYKLDNSLKNKTNMNISARCLATTSESPYLYFGSGIDLRRVEKNNFNNSICVNNNQIRDYQSDVIINTVVDSMGNVFYDTQANGAFKYNPQTQKITRVTDITNNMLCLDYQQNLYSFYINSVGSYYFKLIKVSSDGTLIYNSKVITASSGLLYGVLTIDNNGNIYYIYRNDQQQITITKMINVIKKG